MHVTVVRLGRVVRHHVARQRRLGLLLVLHEVSEGDVRLGLAPLPGRLARILHRLERHRVADLELVQVRPSPVRMDLDLSQRKRRRGNQRRTNVPVGGRPRDARIHRILRRLHRPPHQILRQRGIRMHVLHRLVAQVVCLHDHIPDPPLLPLHLLAAIVLCIRKRQIGMRNLLQALHSILRLLLQQRLRPVLRRRLPAQRLPTQVLHREHVLDRDGLRLRCFLRRVTLSLSRSLVLFLVPLLRRRRHRKRLLLRRSSRFVLS